MNYNILFLGGGGFIGSNLIKKFLNNNAYNIYIAVPSTRNIRKFNEYYDKIKIFQCSLQDTEAISLILVQHSINILVHLASNFLPNSNIEDYEKEFNNILVPTVKLIQICSTLKIKLVYFSSGGTIYGNYHKEKFNENDQTLPISYYGQSKLIIEHSILLENRKNKLKFLILRPSNPYGPGQDIYGTQGLISIAIGKALKNEILYIRGNGSSVRDYIYIDDLVFYTYELINRDYENQIINIGSGEGYSINEIIRIFNQNINIPLKVDYVVSGLEDVHWVVLDVSKLKSMINFKTTPINKGISIFFEQFKKLTTNIL